MQSTAGEGARALREARVLTSDRAEQQGRLDKIEPVLLNYKRRFVDPFLVEPNLSAAVMRERRRVAGQTAQRAQSAAKIQRGLREMEIFERHLLAKRAQELKLAQGGAGRTFMVGSLFTALLAGGLMLLLVRSVGAQNRATLQLGALNDSLKAEVVERRTAEESLRASETGFRHLAEDSVDLICRHAPDGTLTYVSPAARPLLGYTPIEMTGVPVLAVFGRAARAPARPHAPATLQRDAGRHPGPTAPAKVSRQNRQRGLAGDRGPLDCRSRKRRGARLAHHLARRFGARSRRPRARPPAPRPARRGPTRRPTSSPRPTKRPCCNAPSRAPALVWAWGAARFT